MSTRIMVCLLMALISAPGAVIPGYIIIKPDFPECIDDFGFLWFEDEAVVAGSASWVVAGNATEAIVKESK